MDTNAHLEALAHRFLELGATLNLSAAKDFDSLWQRHVLDSLTLLELPEVQQAPALLDLGSGGGFPGLPLAISRPQMRVTLLDSVAKKMAAVDTLIQDVDIPNASTLVGRAEALGRDPAHRQAYAVVVARAVAPLPTLLEYAAPFVALGGFFIAIKGSDVESELAAAQTAQRRLRLNEPRVVPYRLGERTFHHVIYPLKQYVPKAFPRGQGQPRKRPLGSEANAAGPRSVGGEARRPKKVRNTP